MSAKTIVYLRADGSSQIGLGHVHRLLALSEILGNHFTCKFIIKSPLTGIRELILGTCDEIIDPGELDESAELELIAGLLTGKEIVVLDGYHFSTAYQRSIKQSGCGLVCIDDIHHQHYVADIVVNPAGGIDESAYSRERNTLLYTGPGYALLKRPFLMASAKRTLHSGNSLFICMGGADPDNHTLSTLQVCLSLPFDSYYVIVGEAYRYKGDLRRQFREPEKPVNILESLLPGDLAEIMGMCSVAVCSASGIAYEYLSVGGELYIKQTASNQKHLYEYLINEGLAFRLEDLRVSKQRVNDALSKQQKIFDGRSGERIKKIFNRLDFNINCVIRKAGSEDLLKTFEWVNDPELRRQSFNTELVSLDDHTKWFVRKLQDSSTYIYIFVYKGVPVAQIRFDVGDEAVISYSIDRSYRGRGWGELVLRLGIETFQQERSVPVRIVGFVKNDNEGSNRIFENLGFILKSNEVHPGSRKYEYFQP